MYIYIALFLDPLVAYGEMSSVVQHHKQIPGWPTNPGRP